MVLIRSVFCFAFCCSLLAADQITLKNGDVITGAILKKVGDKLTIKNEFLGEVTMPWSAVTSVKSDQPLVVVLPGGKEVSGPVATEGANLEVTTPARQESSPLPAVQAIRGEAEQRRYEKLLRPGLFSLWTGYFDLGLSLARGNARTDTFTGAFNAARVTRHDKTTLFYHQIYSTATINNVPGTTADAARGGVSYDHNLGPRLFVNLFNTDEFDSFQALDFRFVGGGGLGAHFLKSERGMLDIVAGADYNHDAFSDRTTRNVGEIYAGDDFGYKLNGLTSVTQSFRIYDGASTGDYRLNFDAGAATTLRKWLSWQLTASDRYLSNPVLGRRRNDVLLTTGFRVSFAR